MSLAHRAAVFVLCVTGLAGVAGVATYLVVHEVFRSDGRVATALATASTEFRSDATSNQMLVDQLDEIPGVSAAASSGSGPSLDVAVDDEISWQESFTQVAQTCRAGAALYTGVHLRPVVPVCIAHTHAVAVELGNQAFPASGAIRLAAELSEAPGVSHVEIGYGDQAQARVLVTLNGAEDAAEFTTRYEPVVRALVGESVSLRVQDTGAPTDRS